MWVLLLPVAAYRSLDELHCIHPGLEPVWGPLDQTREQSPGPSPSSAPSSVLGRLSALVTPLRGGGAVPATTAASPARKSDTSPVAMLQCVPAGAHVLLFVAHQQSLEAWMLDPSTGADIQWSIGAEQVGAAGTRHTWQVILRPCMNTAQRCCALV
jgi:hypothetical protein